MSRLRAVIADDEPLARARLLRLLGQFPDVEVVADCASGDEAIATLRATRPDVVFLDIQMPELDGFDVLDLLPREERPHVVFVTAYAEHAVRAFAARAADYLLKPVSAERLRSAVERVLPAPERKIRSGLDAANAEYAPRLAVTVGARVHLVPVGDIDFVSAHANYVELHLGTRSLVMRETMNSLESRLDPTRFMRIHRSRMVRSYAPRLREALGLAAGA